MRRRQAWGRGFLLDLTLRALVPRPLPQPSARRGPLRKLHVRHSLAPVALPPERTCSAGLLSARAVRDPRQQRLLVERRHRDFFQPRQVQSKASHGSQNDDTRRHFEDRIPAIPQFAEWLQQAADCRLGSLGVRSKRLCQPVEKFSTAGAPQRVPDALFIRQSGTRPCCSCSRASDEARNSRRLSLHDHKLAANQTSNSVRVSYLQVCRNRWLISSKLSKNSGCLWGLTREKDSRRSMPFAQAHAQPLQYVNCQRSCQAAVPELLDLLD